MQQNIVNERHFQFFIEIHKEECSILFTRLNFIDFIVYHFIFI